MSNLKELLTKAEIKSFGLHFDPTKELPFYITHLTTCSDRTVYWYADWDDDTGKGIAGSEIGFDSYEAAIKEIEAFAKAEISLAL